VEGAEEGSRRGGFEGGGGGGGYTDVIVFSLLFFFCCLMQVLGRAKAEVGLIGFLCFYVFMFGHWREGLGSALVLFYYYSKVSTVSKAYLVEYGISRNRVRFTRLLGEEFLLLYMLPSLPQ